MARHVSRTVAALALLVAGSACSGAREDRATWLVNALVQDNYLFVRREPARAAEKFLKMGAEPYDFLRGTLGPYLRDVSDEPRTTAFSSPDTSRVLALLDPHPENLGTYRGADGRMTLDFADFDAARFAPFHLDVWRLALGLGLIAEGTRPELFDTLTAAAADGYTSTILGSGPRPPSGLIFDDLLFRAARDGDADETLLSFTSTAGDGRRLRRGELEPRVIPEVPVRRFEDVEPWTATQIYAQVPAYLESRLTRPKSFVVLDVVRILGTGVSSLPSLRYIMLVEDGGTRRVLEWKEARDPPSFLAAASPEWELPLRLFAANAQRLVEVMRALQTTPEADVTLGWSPDFRVREFGGYQKGLSFDRIREKFGEGTWKDQDLEAMARHAGHVLASTHVRARTAGDGDARVALAAVLDGRADAFRDEVVARARADAASLAADFVLFNAVIARDGALLGYRP